MNEVMLEVDGRDEEDLSVLPRDTRVVVTGNNRTKSVLVGLRGVVRKAVGLGGWHWLVLTNGIEVKLQRNALSVIEGPEEEAIGIIEQEDDEEEEEEEEDPFPNSTGLLLDSYCAEGGEDEDEDDLPTTTARIFKPARKPRKQQEQQQQQQQQQEQQQQQQPPIMISKHSDPAEQPPSSRRSEKKGESKSHHALPMVDLSKLETAALRRYRRHFKLADVGPHSSKEQLLHAVGRHFMNQQLDELQVITGFMQAAKRLKT